MLIFHLMNGLLGFTLLLVSCFVLSGALLLIFCLTDILILKIVIYINNNYKID